MENDDDRILVDNGVMFEGSREQFTDCFFTNATNDQITGWCFDHGWSLSINGEIIL